MSKKKLNKTVWYGSDVDLQGNAILPPLAESREDLNGIHEGEIYLHNQDDDPGIWVRTNKGNVKRIGFNKKDLDLSEYLKKQVWDTAWELRTTEEGESYIFCKLPFVSQHGVTLYTDGGNIDLPSLYAGIPVDGATITKDKDGKLMLNPNLELGGLDEEALQKYLDDYNYAKITDIDSRINDLVNGAPAAYDTLKEIADVLQGNVNSIGDIITTLGTKADKTYVDTELDKYIPIAGDTEVTGIKNFLNGLKVGGLPISKYEGYDDVIYIDANVVLRGGLTQYAVDPVTIPSIIESLPQAGYESKGVASFSDKYFVIDTNGKVSIIPDSVGLNEEELTAWLANSDYTTKTYVDDTFATKSSLNATNAEVAKKWTQDDDKIANWDTAYSWGNHASAGYFLATNFTKDNIVAKLGISDWALAATKPSYKTSEVTEDTNLYFTNQRAIDALTDTLKAYVTLKGTQTIEGEKDFIGGLKINGSPIVYDSENGYWKLQGNLLITGGLTQYVDDGSVDLPNLYDGLPIDRDTIYWDNGVLKAKVAEGGITSITKDMVIEALGYTPYDATNPNGYITSAALNGYATQTWVNQQGFLTEHQDLSGYQTKITSTNKLAYSLISGTPDLSVYLTTSSASSTYQPKITSSAKLAASLVSGLATVATSGSYNDLSNKPTIPTNTNQLTNGAGYITSSALSSYLPLSGGTLSGDILVPLNPAQSANKASYAITFVDKYLHTRNGELMFGNGSVGYHSIWHSGNSNLSSVDWNASKLILNTTNTTDWNVAIRTNAIQLLRTGKTAGNAPYAYSSGISIMTSYTGFQLATFGGNWNNLYFRSVQDNDTWLPWRTVAFTDSNVASATKLQTARKIWGQDFNGTGDVNGKLMLTSWDSNGVAIRLENSSAGNALISTHSYQSNAYDFGQKSNRFIISHNTYGEVFSIANGNVGIGTTSPAYKLEVNGNGRFNKLLTVGAAMNATNSARAQLFIVSADANPCDLYLGADNARKWAITSRNDTATDVPSGFCVYNAMNFNYALVINKSNNVGIGTTSPKSALDVNGTIWIGAGNYVANRASLILNSNKGNAADIVFKNGSTVAGTFGTIALSVRHESDHRFSIWRGSENGYSASELELFKFYASGDFLAIGGITQYSDIRKKTKLQDVELTLKQVANAPLIEHYYNNDDKKTTHVGSIAQYWADMNDWFCKLDSDGYYTMEIQNAALASAISVARELERYESKTDKKIRMLKKRINELEDEIEKLKK